MGRLHDFEQGARQGIGDDRQDQRCDQGQEKADGKRFFDPFLVICPEALGDDDGETTGNPDRKAHDQEVQGTRRPNGSKSILAERLPDDNGINKVVEKLE